jgi:hypothetical protein
MECHSEARPHCRLPRGGRVAGPRNLPSGRARLDAAAARYVPSRATTGQGQCGGLRQAPRRRRRVDFSVAHRVRRERWFSAALLRNDSLVRGECLSRECGSPPWRRRMGERRPWDGSRAPRDDYLRISISTRNQPNTMPANAPAAIADHIRILALQGFRATSFLPPIPGPVRLPRAAGCEWRADPRAWGSRCRSIAPHARRMG